MSLGPLYVFLGEVSVQVLCPFFNWVVCLPGVELCEFFMYFGDQKQINKEQVLSMWRKGNTFALLVGIQTGAATVENSVEITQKIKNGYAFDTAIPLLGIHPMEPKTVIQKRT